MMQLGVAMMIVAVLLFLLAFMTKRRFGLLGLALAAGSILSGLWVDYASIFMPMLGLQRGSLTEASIGVILILMPAFLTMLHGYAYSSMGGRLFGAFAFSLLSLAFLSTPLSFAFVNTGSMAGIVAFVDGNKDFIIGIGLLVAIGDLVVSSSRRFRRR